MCACDAELSCENDLSLIACQQLGLDLTKKKKKKKKVVLDELESDLHALQVQAEEQENVPVKDAASKAPEAPPIQDTTEKAPVQDEDERKRQ